MGSVVRFCFEPYDHLYMPAVFALWSALAAAFGVVAAAFHGANVAVHAANAALVYSNLHCLLEDRPMPRRARGAAFAGALLFACHPLQVEPVAWVSGMKDLLCGFFSLAALRFYLAFVRGGDRSRTLYGLAIAAYCLALGAKPAAAALPFIKLALDVWVLKRPFKPALGWAGVWLAMALPIIVGNSLAQPTSHLAALLTPAWTRPFIAGDALAFYLGRLVFPFRLALDYGRTPRHVLGSIWGWCAWTVPAGLAACLWRLRAPDVYRAAAAVFAAGILPVCGLLAFQHQGISTTADRYCYLSLFGAALAFAAALARGGNIRVVPAAGLILFWVVLSRRQLRHWKDSAAAYGRAVEVNPGSWVFHDNLGTLAWREGRLPEALKEYRTALRARPDYELGREHLNSLNRALGRSPEARF